MAVRTSWTSTCGTCGRRSTGPSGRTRSRPCEERGTGCERRADEASPPHHDPPHARVRAEHGRAARCRGNVPVRPAVDGAPYLGGHSPPRAGRRARLRDRAGRDGVRRRHRRGRAGRAALRPDRDAPRTSRRVDRDRRGPTDRRAVGAAVAAKAGVLPANDPRRGGDHPNLRAPTHGRGTASRGAHRVLVQQPGRDPGEPPPPPGHRRSRGAPPGVARGVAHHASSASAGRADAPRGLGHLRVGPLAATARPGHGRRGRAARGDPELDARQAPARLRPGAAVRRRRQPRTPDAHLHPEGRAGPLALASEIAERGRGGGAKRIGGGRSTGGAGRGSPRVFA